MNIIPKTHIILFILVLASVSLLFVMAGSTLVPVVLAFFLAYLTDPLVAFFERYRINRSLAVLLIFALLFVLFFLAGSVLVSVVTAEFHTVQPNLNDYASRLYSVIPDQAKMYLGIETPERITEQVRRILGEMRGASVTIAREAFTVVSKAFTSTLDFVLGLLGFLITPVYLYYFLKDMPKIREALPQLIPEAYRSRVLVMLGEIDDVLTAFIRGQLLVCALLALLYSVGLFFIGIDLAVFIGTFAGIAFIIPYLGTILGIVSSMVMAALKFHDFLHPLLCLGWFLAVQALEGGVITPKIVGDKVGLHPVVTIFAIILGGQLLGVLGMLLAVPVTAVLNVLTRSLIASYRTGAFPQDV